MTRETVAEWLWLIPMVGILGYALLKWWQSRR
jgi:hypothetical protein